jgi:hypothetical protein
VVEGECDAWGRNESDDTTMFGHDESATAWDGHGERSCGVIFFLCNDDTKKKQEESRHPTQFFSTSMAILSVGFPPVGDDAFFFSLLPWIYPFLFLLLPDYSLSITPSSFPFFFLLTS